MVDLGLLAEGPMSNSLLEGSEHSMSDPSGHDSEHGGQFNYQENLLYFNPNVPMQREEYGLRKRSLQQVCSRAERRTVVKWMIENARQQGEVPTACSKTRQLWGLSHGGPSSDTIDGDAPRNKPDNTGVLQDSHIPGHGETLAYARMLEDAGCSLLAVHGRAREQKDGRATRADWEAIKAVKDAVRILVLEHGNIRWLEDVHECMKVTGVEGVMSAESLLENPA